MTAILRYTHFIRPHGTQVLKEREIDPEDLTFIQAHNIKISSEDQPNGQFVVYFDYGATYDDGAPDEWLTLSGTLTFRETIAAGLRSVRRIVESRMARSRGEPPIPEKRT